MTRQSPSGQGAAGGDVIAGTLYVVATPVGHLADLSARAQAVLAGVDWILAEDTRRTGRMLATFDIDAKLVSFHAHNERERLPRLLERLAAGDAVAVVSDAGTPGVADPGFTVVRAAVEAGLAVEVVPGPAAFLLALVVSGLPLSRFAFEGFPPRRAGRLRQHLAGVRELPHTLVFYEAAPRLLKFLEAVHEVLGARRIAVCRELTKRHQDVWRGSVDAYLAASPQPLRGEFTVVVAGAEDQGRRQRQARE